MNLQAMLRNVYIVVEDGDTWRMATKEDAANPDGKRFGWLIAKLDEKDHPNEGTKRRDQPRRPEGAA